MAEMDFREARSSYGMMGGKGNNVCREKET
jgi:hypothetical protein